MQFVHSWADATFEAQPITRQVMRVNALDTWPGVRAGRAWRHRSHPQLARQRFCRTNAGLRPARLLGRARGS
jgi:hypothetical protein